MSLKLPLSIATSQDGWHILDADKLEIAFFLHGEHRPHAEALVRLANQHAELLAALELCFSAIRGKAQVDCEEMDDLIARCKEAK